MAGANKKSTILTKHERDDIDSWIARFPEDRSQSALLAALRAVMHEDHYLSTEKMDAVAERLGIKMGESTPDGQFFFKVEEECLAACCGAPMMQLNHVYHENLTTEKVDALLESAKTNGSLHKQETS